MFLILFNISCPYPDYVRKFGEDYGSCQAGISSFYIGVCIEDTKFLTDVCKYTHMLKLYVNTNISTVFVVVEEIRFISFLFNGILIILA